MGTSKTTRTVRFCHGFVTMYHPYDSYCAIPHNNHVLPVATTTFLTLDYCCLCYNVLSRMIFIFVDIVCVMMSTKRHARAVLRESLKRVFFFTCLKVRPFPCVPESYRSFTAEPDPTTLQCLGCLSVTALHLPGHITSTLHHTRYKPRRPSRVTHT